MSTTDNSRENRLNQALRENLRKRKAGTAPIKSDADTEHSATPSMKLRTEAINRKTGPKLQRKR